MRGRGWWLASGSPGGPGGCRACWPRGYPALEGRDGRACPGSGLQGMACVRVFPFRARDPGRWWPGRGRRGHAPFGIAGACRGLPRWSPAVRRRRRPPSGTLASPALMARRAGVTGDVNTPAQAGRGLAWAGASPALASDGTSACTWDPLVPRWPGSASRAGRRGCWRSLTAMGTWPAHRVGHGGPASRVPGKMSAAVITVVSGSAWVTVVRAQMM